MVDLSRIELKPGHGGVACRDAFHEGFLPSPHGMMAVPGLDGRRMKRGFCEALCGTTFSLCAGSHEIN